MRAVAEATVNELKGRLKVGEGGHPRPRFHAIVPLSEVDDFHGTSTIGSHKRGQHSCAAALSLLPPHPCGLQDRDKQLEGLERALAAEKAAWHAQHVTDRLEIERLNQCLFERNDRSIANLKVLILCAIVHRCYLVSY
jgi:hypothetical protein